MKIIVPGGSGQVGVVLIEDLLARGHEVITLGRGTGTNLVGVKHLQWDAKTLGTWTSQVDGADAIINLVGRSVNCRYTPENRRLILESRVDSTRIIGQAIAQSSRPPSVWLQAATATIYAHRFDAPNDDINGMIGGDEPDAPDTWRFSIAVAKAWEAALEAANTPKTRKVALRSAMIMDSNPNGVFDTLLRLVRYGLGGTNGNGKQFISWMHFQDFTQAISFLLETQTLSGAVNLASPNPLPNAEFMQILRQTANMPFGLPSTTWMLELGAYVLQTETELLLKSRYVVPKRILEAGFRFEFADWNNAATDLLERWKNNKKA